MRQVVCLLTARPETFHAEDEVDSSSTHIQCRDSENSRFFNKMSIELRRIFHLVAAMSALPTVLPFKLAATDA